MESEIKFEPSGQTGVVATGSYLLDAARRMGVSIETECGGIGKCDSCAVKVTDGRDLLSELTAAEIEHLSDSQRARGKRLSCQAKIEKPGELVVMVTEKKLTEEEKEQEKQEAQKKQARKEFEELPLEKKVANLLELEAIALSETVSLVINSPFLIFGKIMDVLAEFGLKMDEKDKQSKRPSEHASEKSAHETKDASDKQHEKQKATEPASEAP